jgi:hypothetical protein
MLLFRPARRIDPRRLAVGRHSKWTRKGKCVGSRTRESSTVNSHEFSYPGTSAGPPGPPQLQSERRRSAAGPCRRLRPPARHSLVRNYRPLCRGQFFILTQQEPTIVRAHEPARHQSATASVPNSRSPHATPPHPRKDRLGRQSHMSNTGKTVKTLPHLLKSQHFSPPQPAVNKQRAAAIPKQRAAPRDASTPQKETVLADNHMCATRKRRSRRSPSAANRSTSRRSSPPLTSNRSQRQLTTDH